MRLKLHNLCSIRFFTVRISVVFLFTLPFTGHGQNEPIHIDDSLPIADIVKALQGPGAEISNITFSMPPQSKAIGYFEDVGGLLGLKKGLVMTTQEALRAVGPNNTDGEADAGTNVSVNDPDLATITPGPFFDVAVVEFDIKTNYSKFSFSFTFGSEEYPEFVNGVFNDSFGFFISGPGIEGKQNIALLENGSSVSIHSINPFVNTEFYRSNAPGDDPDLNQYLQYDGFTTKLVATALVVPNETYHIKLIIADVADDDYDSGVFIEQESFASEVAVMANVSFQHDSFGNALEGCNKGYITINRILEDATLPLELDISLLGTAENGVDFSTVQTGILVMAAGQQEAILEIDAIIDNLPEGEETIMARIVNTATSSEVVAQLAIRDELSYAINDNTICAATPTPINKQADEGNFSFRWPASTALSCKTCATPLATLDNPSSFNVEVTHKSSGCVAHATAMIFVERFKYSFDDEIVCRDTPTLINRKSSDNYQYRWNAHPGLDCTDCATPSLSSLTDATLLVEVHNIATGCSTQSKLQVVVHDFNFTFDEVTVCENTPTLLNKSPSPGYTFTWSPHPNLSCTDCSSPSIQTSADASLEVDVKEPVHGCITHTNLTVRTNRVDYEIPDSYVCWGEENDINVSGSNNYSYLWKENAALSCTSCKSPHVTLHNESSFVVNVKDKTTGCTKEMNALVKINVINYPATTTPVCENTPTAINTQAPADYSFQWNPSNELSCLTCASPIITTDEDQLLTAQIEDSQTGCHGTLHVPIVVTRVSYPVIPQEICNDTPTAIHTTFPTGYSFRWIPDTKLSCLNCSSPRVVLQDNTSFKLEVTENETACATIVTVPVRVKKVEALFSYTLTDQYHAIVAGFDNLSSNANEYVWDFGNGAGSAEFEPSHQYEPLGEEIKVTLTAINTLGLYCEAHHEVSFRIHEPVFIPNVLTPNDDPYNQYFKVAGIESGVWHLRVFNSWGTPVYRSDAYQNNWYGENVEGGVYYYELRHPQDDTAFKGWVHVIK